MSNPDAMSDHVSVRAGSWIKREVSVGNLLLVLGMVGAIGAGIWEGGMLRQSMADSVRLESEIRIAEAKFTNDRLIGLANRVSEVGLDVRELRALIVAGRIARPQESTVR